MKPDKSKRSKPERAVCDLQSSQLAVGTLILVSILYAVTII